MGSILDKVAGGDRWKACKYEIGVTLKFSSGTTRKLEHSQIAGLYIEKDFDTDHLPVMMIDLALNDIDEKNVDSSTEFHVQIKQYYVTKAEGSKKSPKILLNDTFVRLNYGKNPDSNNKTIRKIRQENGYRDLDDVSMDDLASQETYPLVRKSDLILSKNIVNANLVDVNQLQILSFILQEGGLNKKYLLSNIMNSEVIHEVIVEPKGFLQNLLQFEREYGWHEEGTCIFLDYDMLYLIRMNGVCTAWRQNEQKMLTFCITDSTNDDATIPTGVLVKPDVVYFNIGSDNFLLSNASEMSDQIEGHNMILNNTIDGSQSSINGKGKSYSGRGSYQTKTYHGHNPYIANQQQRRTAERQNQVRMTCLNGDISFLTPNKAVQILTDVSGFSKYFKTDSEGGYRLASFKSSMIKNGDSFDNSTEILVKRVQTPGK